MRRPARILAILGLTACSTPIETGMLAHEDGSLRCGFVQRTDASGQIGFRDLGGDAGPEMVRRMLGRIARAVRQESLERLGAPVEGGVVESLPTAP